MSVETESTDTPELDGGDEDVMSLLAAKREQA